MSLTKYFLIGGVLLFGAIAFVGRWKRPGASLVRQRVEVEEIALPAVREREIAVKPLPPVVAAPVVVTPAFTPSTAQEQLPEANRIERLFALDGTKLPFVETIAYTSRAPWMQGRPAWITDYATHYKTSRHFIARSLNRKPDYFTQKIFPGDRFNVLKENVEFYLLIDLSRCRLWFYALDVEKKERVLLKSYRVGLGKLDPKRASGSLTPTGKYRCGDRITVYKPGVMGYYRDEKIEMMRVFGSRWIPFDQEVGECSESARGLGLHGAPWIEDRETGSLVEDLSKIGKYESDGCIRLASEDVEELFAIVVSRPTTVELVKDFYEAKLPGVEREL
ncbi:MAG: L,D-transpeptidase [Verrucomicrobiota bacterium]|nr:L,D-transpeptidase [Verrucomicrobiota bacterium]